MIKNIKKLTGNLPKEELKKRISSVALLALGVMLTASSVPISESYLKHKEDQQKIIQEIEIERKKADKKRQEWIERRKAEEKEK